jgi:hypothetical protein
LNELHSSVSMEASSISLHYYWKKRTNTCFRKIH